MIPCPQCGAADSCACRCDPARPSANRYETITRITRRDGTEIRIEVAGQTQIDVRLWEPGRDGDIHASGRGVRVSAAEAAQIASAIDQAIETIETRRQGRERGQRDR